MAGDPERERLDLRPRTLRVLLRNLADPQVLGKSPLTRTRRVDRIVSQLRLKDTDYGRGLVLSMIIEDLIRERYENPESESESLTWGLLWRRYIQGLSNDRIASEFSISPRTLARHHDKALALLASTILVTLARDFEEPDSVEA